MAFGNLRRAVFAAALLAIVAGDAQAGKSKPARKASEAAAPAAPLQVADPILTLLRDRAVQKELQLDESQAAAVEQAVTEVDLPLFQLRDQATEAADSQRKELVDRFRARVATGLQPAQQRRLAQLVVQAQGWPATLLRENSAALELTEDQRIAIRDIVVETRDKAAELEKKAGAFSTSPQQKELRELRDRERERILALLQDRQKPLLGALTGKEFDLSRVRVATARAPEFVGVAEWINGSPLTVASLQGRVAAVHFFAYG